MLQSNHRSRPLLATCILLLILSLATVSLVSLPVRQPYASVPAALIQQLSSIRPSGARLFNAAAMLPPPDDTHSTLRNAQVAVLSMEDGRRIQGLIDINRGDLESAATATADLSRAYPADAQILNDLGVIYLVLGDHDATQYLKAIQVLERARHLYPTAPAPRFNLVLAYRRAGLNELARMRQIQYEHLEKNPSWVHDLNTVNVEPDASQIAFELRRILAAKDETHATSLFEKHVEIFRRLATDEALNPSGDGTPSAILRFTANRLMVDFQDVTIPSMLIALDGPYRSRIIKSRMLVDAGTSLYFQSKYGESLRLYDQAESELSGIPPGFDHLWIELNRANAEIHLACPTCRMSAKTRLESIIQKSREQHFRWLVGQALTTLGSDSALTSNYGQLAQTLTEAISELSSIGAHGDTARAVNYLGYVYNAANDFDRSFQYAHLALTLAQQDDHIRRSQLFILAGMTAYRIGCLSCAIAYGKQGVAEARMAGNHQIAISTILDLAAIYEAGGQRDLARHYYDEIRNIVDPLPQSQERDFIELPLNLLCSRIELDAGNRPKAERCLQNNLAILHAQTVSYPVYHSRTLMEMARVSIRSGKMDQVRESLRQATEVVENDDANLANPQLRSSFENERRSLYDSVIAFEVDHSGMDAAWTYLQRYQSKLFLEFLGQMNPKVNEIHSEAVRRDQVQKRIPGDVQVMEYVMLPDRLLIWLVSNEKFVSKSVPVSRAELQKIIVGYLEGMRNHGEVKAQSEKLFGYLIAPIEDKLDPHRALAIIPDQDLHRLPFPALRNAATHRYLVEDYALLESPNLTQLLAASGTPSRTSVVAFGAIADGVSTSGELSALKAFYPADKIFRDSASNKQEFLSAMKNALVFHYSGHSVDASDPLRSSLLLDGDHEGPNSITALDISQQHMQPNSLVVLASCDSSVGNSRDGVGMRGLTSAFLISGAGSVVGSLWLVETVSTSRLVSDFHRSFAGGTSSAQALRQAQIALIKSGPRTSHPYYWSGFVVTGNISALR